MVWSWVALDVVLAIHDRQIAEHGGLDGTRDAALVESALARPQNLAAYGEPDAADLAAAYANAIAKNHGFSGGNKRSAWVAARTFLMLNGVLLKPDRAESVEQMVRLAEGALDEAAFAAWLRLQPTSG